MTREAERSYIEKEKDKALLKINISKFLTSGTISLDLNLICFNVEQNLSQTFLRYIGRHICRKKVKTCN